MELLLMDTVLLQSVLTAFVQKATVIQGLRDSGDGYVRESIQKLPVILMVPIAHTFSLKEVTEAIHA
jgi:hypothetical protein